MNFGGMATLENLKKYTYYAVVIQCFNSKGPGPISIPVYGKTDEDGESFFPLNCSLYMLFNTFIYNFYFVLRFEI